MTVFQRIFAQIGLGQAVLESVVSCNQRIFAQINLSAMEMSKNKLLFLLKLNKNVKKHLNTSPSYPQGGQFRGFGAGHEICEFLFL
jgi:hypothetical protein